MGCAQSSHERDETERILVAGRPNYQRCDNTVITAKFTVFTFLPLVSKDWLVLWRVTIGILENKSVSVQNSLTHHFACFNVSAQAIREQFRRFANLYFLVIGLIMFIGDTTRYFKSAYSYWTTLGPLAFVISCSLLVEGSADLKRHRSDKETNNAECIILRRSDEINRERTEREASIIGGKNVIVNLSKQNGLQSTTEAPDLVQIAFQKIKRMNIRQGHIVLIRNREEIPADVVILATSGENGCAYIETSSIDGETNLKLRNTPTLPSAITRSESEGNLRQLDGDDEEKTYQSLERATKNVTRFSALGHPDGVSAIGHHESSNSHDPRRSKSTISPPHVNERSDKSLDSNGPDRKDSTPHIATLVSETPNSYISTFSGKLVLPPLEKGGDCIEIPLDAENILLRGAVLRNTEWVIGLSCFTGKDTKLVRNSSQTPSKFSRIDVLINKCVVLIIVFMLICIAYLSVRAVHVTNNRFDELW